MSRCISLAYSPDTDDAFMVYAMKQGFVDLKGYEFIYTSDDIQKLNEQALQGVYDITAISIASYPDIAGDYWLMPIGASIGDGFGPVVVCSDKSPLQNLADLEGKKVAVPGLKTSGFFALSSLAPNFEPVPMPFFKIEDAIFNGEVDAGLLIHERQLNYSVKGLRLLLDVGCAWTDQHQLPLPLGANAVHKRVGVETAKELTAIYRMSIEWALSNREKALKEASAQAFQPLSEPALADLYISRYVNQRSLAMQADVIRAMEILFDLGEKKGLSPKLAQTNYICKEQGWQ